MKTPASTLPLHAGRPPAETLGIVVALTGLVAAYCCLLWPEWTHNPDLSHAFFAPLIFALLVWEGRDRGTRRWIPAGRGPAAALGLILAAGFMLFALAGIFAASLMWSHALVCFILAASLGCFLLAGLLILADVRLRIVPFNWITLTAVFLWLLVAPIPDGTYSRLTLGLQGWVTGSVLQSLHVLGVPARQHGNVIELATATVGVEEACSGIRSLISCVFAGFFFAAWLVRRPPGRLVLILAAPLLALGMNFLRSLTLTLLANAGKDITGLWHDATGFAILGVTAAILAGLAILLESKDPAPVDSAAPAPLAPPRWPVRFFWTALTATVALGSFYFSKNRSPDRPKDQPAPHLAALLPAHPANWQVVTPNDLYQFADILQTSNLMERTYLRSTSPGQLTQFTVYVAYWAPGQAPVSRVASHTPDACWPGSGWIAQPLAESRQTLKISGSHPSPAEHRLFTNTVGFPQNVWFWHIYDGHVIGYRDPYSLPALFQLALQYGFRRPSEQYFVRISSNQPWSELKDEPLVQEILTNFSRIGL